jgi:hypothetical protein
LTITFFPGLKQGNFARLTKMKANQFFSVGNQRLGEAVAVILRTRHDGELEKASKLVEDARVLLLAAGADFAEAARHYERKEKFDERFSSDVRDAFQSSLKSKASAFNVCSRIGIVCSLLAEIFSSLHSHSHCGLLPRAFADMEEACVEATADARAARLLLESVRKNRSPLSVINIWGNVRDVHGFDAYTMEHGVVSDFTEAFFSAMQSRSFLGMHVSRTLVEMSAREKHLTFISLFELLSDDTQVAITNFTMAAKCVMGISKMFRGLL